jgi:hypothetical protein
MGHNYGIQCHRYNRIGHLQKDCPSTTDDESNISSYDVEEDIEDDTSLADNHDDNDEAIRAKSWQR